IRPRGRGGDARPRRRVPTAWNAAVPAWAIPAARHTAVPTGTVSAAWCAAEAAATAAPATAPAPAPLAVDFRSQRQPDNAHGQDDQHGPFPDVASLGSSADR